MSSSYIYTQQNEDEGEDAFSEMSMKERAKIERETVNLVAGRDKSKDRYGYNLKSERGAGGEDGDLFMCVGLC